MLSAGDAAVSACRQAGSAHVSPLGDLSDRPFVFTEHLLFILCLPFPGNPSETGKYIV